MEKKEEIDRIVETLQKLDKSSLTIIDNSAKLLEAYINLEKEEALTKTDDFQLI